MHRCLHKDRIRSEYRTPRTRNDSKASVISSDGNDTASRQLWTIDAYRIPIEVAIGWQRLAERQCGYLHELHRTGRWRRHYDEDEFRRALQEAVESARQWATVV